MRRSPVCLRSWASFLLFSSPLRKCPTTFSHIINIVLPLWHIAHTALQYFCNAFRCSERYHGWRMEDGGCKPL
ncbi:uncharacterized protein LY89DRAFT_403920 [Mollisia scopiformis]|uniref:Uncharacterized protein n=1 Tax=Mollisia scopiformis TaxID=149040 RepID=A0A132B2T7_MOLSC|nr:uncharacterized protein LY89DRAFT_403920 [Mollisia scopiformis]KUJ06702.1 hypothetical protein LY89DRAFT_403920 [Mollisia scopiformis]